MKPDTPERDFAIRRLQFLVRTYDDLNKIITSTKNRLCALNPEVEYKHDFILGGEGESKGLEAIKDKTSRVIEKELRNWPLYTRWLKNVKGIGPAIAANLILLYYYKFTAICPDCGTVLVKKEVEGKDGKPFNTFYCASCEKSVKGDGVLKHRVEMREFATMSKWWKFIGIAIDPETGRKPMRQKRVVANWSAVGRKTAYLVGDQFNRQTMKTPYGAFLVERKQRSMRLHPERSKGHHLNCARHEAAKLFLSHMYQVAHEIDGIPIQRPEQTAVGINNQTGVYAITILGHTGYAAPFYWGSRLESDLEKGREFDFIDPANHETPPPPVKPEKKARKPRAVATARAKVARARRAAA